MIGTDSYHHVAKDNQGRFTTSLIPNPTRKRDLGLTLYPCDLTIPHILLWGSYENLFDVSEWTHLFNKKYFFESG